jgi:hypothetical protein
VIGEKLYYINYITRNIIRYITEIQSNNNLYNNNLMKLGYHLIILISSLDYCYFRK